MPAHVTATGIPDFFLIGLHAQPGSKVTASELNALVEVYDSATEVFQTNNGVMMGDFNADCTYLSKAKYDELDLVTDDKFTWLLDSDEDTTTGNTHCAYDRLVECSLNAYMLVTHTYSVATVSHMHTVIHKHTLTHT